MPLVPAVQLQARAGLLRHTSHQTRMADTASVTAEPPSQQSLRHSRAHGLPQLYECTREQMEPVCVSAPVNRWNPYVCLHP